MTDITNWADTVHIMKYPGRNAFTGEEEYLIERIMVPLDHYQMGNLIDAIGQVQDTGDWWHEICHIVARAMQVARLDKLHSNRGNTFTLQDVIDGNIRRENGP